MTDFELKESSKRYGMGWVSIIINNVMLNDDKKQEFAHFIGTCKICLLFQNIVLIKRLKYNWDIITGSPLYPVPL